MRLNVVLEGAQGLTIDIRSKVADAATSFAASLITGAADGQKNSLLVEADDVIGAAAFLVVMDTTGKTIFKHPVVMVGNFDVDVEHQQRLGHLADDLATKVTVVYFSEAKDALLKALSE